MFVVVINSIMVGELNEEDLVGSCDIVLIEFVCFRGTCLICSIFNGFAQIMIID